MQKNVSGERPASIARSVYVTQHFFVKLNLLKLSAIAYKIYAASSSSYLILQFKKPFDMESQNSKENLTEFPISHHKIHIGSERNFGVVFTAVFGAIGGWPVIFSSGNIRWWAIAVASVFLCISVIRPVLLKPLNHAWFKLGILLGKVVSPVVMMLVFIVAVTPTALIMRLLGKDPLRIKKIPTSKKTAWVDRSNDGHKMGSMKNQF